MDSQQGQDLTPEVMFHNFRKMIDGNIKQTENLQRLFSTSKNPELLRSLAIVRTKLQEAKMWGGKCLEALGAPFPAELRDEADPL